MAAPTNKKYGLITLPKKGSKAPPVQRPNIFDDDSDEDAMAAVNREIVLSSQKNKAKRQTQLEIDRALADDPSVYSYDEVYDDMKKEEKKLVEDKLNIKQNKDRKPKYMTGLLKAAEKRNKEHERRAEKKVQKEREAEGDEFADKEKFVTSAYKKKMAEMEALEAEEKRKEAIEDALDVTKQKDMSGFYRNLYKQTVGNEPKQEPVEQVKTEPSAESPSKVDKTSSKRQYRQRDRDSSSPEQSNRERERSRSKDRRHRSRSRDRRHRSRSRDRRRRSRSGERRRSRDRSRSRGRRSRRSRSREGHQERRRQRTERSEDVRRSKDQTVKKESSLSETKPAVKGNSPQAENGDQPSSTNTGEVKERFAKRNNEETVQSARERYLARKAAKIGGV